MKSFKNLYRQSYLQNSKNSKSKANAQSYVSGISLKLLIKKSFLFDSTIGYTFKVIDYRKPTHRTQEITLTEPLRLEGINPQYVIETGEKPYWYNLFKQGIQLQSFAYYILPDTYLIGKGVILNERKELILESAIFQREYLNKLLKNHLILRAKFSSITQKLPPVIPLLNRLSNNYYHWTTEQLARLAMLIYKSNTTINDYHIVIAKGAPFFVKESLMLLFNVPAEKIIEWGNDEVAKTENTLLIAYNFIRTPQTGMTNVYHPDTFTFLNQPADKNIPEEPGEYTYLILSRKNSTGRILLNENKIADALSEFPFKVITLEDMPFMQQLQLFRKARIIIGSHGAGFINLIYCNCNPLVIEIFPSTRKIRDAALFFQVSSAKNLRHHLIIQPAVNEHQDMEVDSSLLERLTSIVRKQVKAHSIA